MLTTENIHLNIGRKNILHNVSFQANKGELLAIVGANGAGKSSLLKIISGDTSASKGSTKLNGKLIHQYKKTELAKIRAVLAQSFSLNLSFLVKEVVMMGRYPHFNEIPTSQDHLWVEKALQETAVYHLKERVYTNLSGGEKQRVQLARVLAQVWKEEKAHADEKAHFLFLDEPVSSLDLLQQHKTLNLACKLKRKGFVVIAVLHDLNLASQYADKILMLKEGTVIAFGKTRDVLTPEHILEGFGMPVSLHQHPEYNYPFIIPNPLKQVPKKETYKTVLTIDN